MPLQTLIECFRCGKRRNRIQWNCELNCGHTILVWTSNDKTPLLSQDCYHCQPQPQYQQMELELCPTQIKPF